MDNNLRHAPDMVAKIQPQAVPLEEAVLGAIMLDRDALSIVCDFLTAEMFYVEYHQIIYNSMLSLFRKNLPIDLLTLVERMKSKSDTEISEIEKVPGEANYLVELTNRVASAANIEYHARIISQKWMARELIKVSGETIKDAYTGGDVIELLDRTERSIFSIAAPSATKASASASSLVASRMKKIEEAAFSEGLLGVPSGFTDVDRITHGWMDTDLIIVAARPGMGKTSYALALAKNAVMQFDKSVAIFSLEMSKGQLVDRLIAMDSEINLKSVKSNRNDDEMWGKIGTSVNRISSACEKLIIDDQGGLSLMQLRSKARRLKMRHDIDMIVIDYLQLMTAEGNRNSSTNDKVAEISKGLKALAKELKVPVICLSQLSRSVEKRGGSKRPILSDLRDSGAIEQDADMVQFIYRDEYYSIFEDEEGNDTRGTAEVIIAKHRNGDLTTVKMKFVNHIAKFMNLNDWDESIELGDYHNPNYAVKLSSSEDIPF